MDIFKCTIYSYGLFQFCIGAQDHLNEDSGRYIYTFWGNYSTRTYSYEMALQFRFRSNFGNIDSKAKIQIPTIRKRGR